MYQPYRGQRARRGRTIRQAVIVLLCLFILVCLLFLLFFRKDGVVKIFGMELRLPHAAPTSDAAAPKGDDPLNFEVVGADPAAPAPAPAPAPKAAKTLEIPAGKAADAAYVAQVAKLAAKGWNAAAITIKDPTGAVTGVDALKPTLDTLHAAGMKVTAVLYAYEDNVFAKQTPAAALKNANGDAWRTADGLRWLDPASDAANDYLAGQLRACKNAGFDEVVLRSFGWPAGGRLDRVAYGASNTGALRAGELSARLTALSAQAAPMKLSVALDDPTAANGLSEASGQDAAKLYAASAQVYVPMAVQTETSGDSIRTIVGRVTGGDTAKLVPMYTSAALAPALLAGDKALYFSPAETQGNLAPLLQ